MCAFRSRAGMNAAKTASSTRVLAEVTFVRNGVSSRASASSNPAPDKVGGSKNGTLFGASANGTLRKAAALVPSVREERLQKVLEMIESGRPCTIHALAQELNLSPSHLQHIFKQQTGMSLGQLLTEKKLHRAAYLLAHSDLRIKEIANSTGYEHSSSFIRAFERYFGEPPRLYRKNLRASRKS